MARGKSRSNAISHVLDDVKSIAEQGVKEIVLTGINLGDFGKGLHGGKKKEESFFELVQALEEQNNVSRFRISSIEPNLLTEEMIEFISRSEKFMPHFHIPLQSGHNRILGLMKRRYQRELYQDRVKLIKSLMPHCCIGVDLIVGFPGETDEEFKESAKFIEDMDVSYLHVFTYSERDNTLAATMSGVVPVNIRNERNAILRNLSYQKMQYFTSQHVGQKRPVLFESANKNGMMEGYTDNYIKISALYKKEWENQIVDWTI
jgi:threonylcarbamoyladenosine tRNA methylthiotransferase MtaB